MTDYMSPSVHKSPVEALHNDSQISFFYCTIDNRSWRDSFRQKIAAQSTPPRIGYRRHPVVVIEDKDDKVHQNDARWIFKAIASSDIDGAQLIPDVIDGVNRLIAKRQYLYLDRVFDVIPPSTAGRHVLLALLRASAPVSSKLSGWKNFVHKVEESFKSRGLDSGRLLRGLLD